MNFSFDNKDNINESNYILNGSTNYFGEGNSMDKFLSSRQLIEILY